MRRAISTRYYYYLGGQHWTGWWGGYLGFFREFCRDQMDVPAEIWDRSVAYQDASAAGWWWPHRQFVIVSERPEFIHREQIGARGWRSHQLHCDDGPAMRWRDGFAIYSWHGVQVPAWVTGVDGGPTLERIRGESNTEVRRCAIEAFGWGRYLKELDLRPVSVEADPGNPGHELALFDLPDSQQLYGERVRLLVMRNASLDRDGTRRTFAETVPASCATAVEAAAWQFEVPVEQYRELVRAT